jgi:hypothetical protein
MKITNMLTDDVKQILSEESINAIQTAFQSKTDLLIEAALVEQDTLYAEKLEQLMTAIDVDHTKKLRKVVEAVDRSNAKKLLKVVNRYEAEINSKAKEFKTAIIESVSSYLEEYIDEAIPAEAILEATKNRTATTVLQNLRKVLAVDSALMSESVKGAVVDGKNQITELSDKVAKLTAENNIIKENYNKVKANLILENKTSHLTAKKKDYLKKVLGDKSPKFIEENFDYTLRLFERKDQDRINMIKEEAFDNRKVKADAPQEIQRESTTQFNNPYVDELLRFK